MKRAKMESVLGRTDRERDPTAATTEVVGAGAGAWTGCTVMWAAAQRAQSAWLAPSAWVCAT